MTITAEMFTPRELQVIERLADGKTHIQIGRDLQLAPGTVANHCLFARRKTGAASNAELVAIAVRHRVIL